MEDILNKLKEIFINCTGSSIDSNSINLNTNLKEELQIDSLGLILLAGSIEMEYNIDMGEVTADTFKTVEDVCLYIKERL